MTHLCSGEHLSAVLYLLADLPHNGVLKNFITFEMLPGGVLFTFVSTDGEVFQEPFPGAHQENDARIVLLAAPQENQVRQL